MERIVKKGQEDMFFVLLISSYVLRDMLDTIFPDAASVAGARRAI